MSVTVAFFLGGLSCLLLLGLSLAFVFHVLTATPRAALESLGVLLKAFSEKVPSLYVVVKTKGQRHIVSFEHIARAVARAQCLRTSTGKKGPYAAKISQAVEAPSGDDSSTG